MPPPEEVVLDDDALVAVLCSLELAELKLALLLAVPFSLIAFRTKP